jgi:pilus assembly protein Flp/PilA
MVNFFDIVFYNNGIILRLVNFMGRQGMSSFVHHLFSFFRDEGGASAAEYALILAIVTTGIAGATIFLGQTISNAISDAATCISTEGISC